ncbi:MAG: hypothetical protein NUV80_01915 [Candidatus Berkelbacteria bacterium]|nr:hypothetical protein [Candidatus Berkelbacteria bacterium]MCR4307291.1 hypothetical protein [Candidatus Berkelbacteria bacterium]
MYCHKEFRKKRSDVFARWLIGQALENLQSVGAIHQVARRFVEEWRKLFLYPATDSGFKGLSERRRITPDMAVLALENYAYGGAAISADVVQSVFRRVSRKISRPMLKRALLAAQHGKVDQARRGFEADARHYELVSNYLTYRVSR